MPLPVKSVPPERTQVGVSLMITTAIRAFERMRAQFAFLGFQPWWVNLGVSFATPAKFSVVFRFVWAVTFDTFGSLDFARECYVAPLPTVFALWNSRVYVGSSDSHNEITDVEISVD